MGFLVESSRLVKICPGIVFHEFHKIGATLLAVAVHVKQKTEGLDILGIFCQYLQVCLLRFLPLPGFAADFFGPMSQ